MNNADKVYNSVVVGLGDSNGISGPFIIQSYADQEIERYKQSLKTEIEAYALSGIISNQAMQSILDIIDTTEIKI